jgi:A/G-specific adenine glycosylase
VAAAPRLRHNVRAMDARSLLAWYRRVARDLPWRRTRDPYAVWVSEIMLQQTQIATVVPYFERWMRRFPDVKALARAPLDAVLKSWEGLGYYARARNLHRAAKEMAEPPRDSEGWREVPGVGPYTAAAIASICFGERVPVFDGNVRRVLSRLEARDVTGPPPVPRGKPGDYNQALMELGQRICRPRNPLCGDCPLGKRCAARRKGEVDRWPVKKARKAVPHKEVSVGIIWKGERFYVQRRKEEGLLGGLWEFPGGKREQGETFEACLVREIREETGFSVDVGPLLGVVRHAYTHFTVELHAYHCFLRKGKGPGRWVTAAEAGALAMPKANLKMLAELARSGRPLPLRGRRARAPIPLDPRRGLPIIGPAASLPR